MNMEHIVISESQIADYLFSNLIKLGYVPEEAELEDIAMLVFDFLLEVGVMDPDLLEEEGEE
jgi:hypothetical protein